MVAPRALSPYASAAAFFGAELRRHRERLEWSQGQVAAALSWSESLVAKIERGERLPPDGFGEACDRAFGLSGSMAHLESLAHAIPAWFTEFVSLEARATRIGMWEMRLIPGLLQTAEYARVIVAATQPRAAPEKIEQVVADRMARQAILDRPEPPLLHVTLHECVVRQPLADASVTKRQIDHLLDLADRPNVTLRVLPYASACVAGASGPFFLFEFADQPPMGSAEGYGEGRMVDGNELIDLQLIYDRIGSAALTEEQSTGLLAGAWDAVWTSRAR